MPDDQLDLEPLAKALDAAGKIALAKTTRETALALEARARRRAVEPSNGAIEPGRELVFRPLGAAQLVRAQVAEVLFDGEAEAGGDWTSGERRRLVILRTTAGSLVQLERRTGLFGPSREWWAVAPDLAAWAVRLSPDDPLDLQALGALGLLDGLPEV